MLGTFAYMSPENWDDSKRIGKAADVYALGVILYEMLSGQPPFRANNMMAYCRKHTVDSPPELPDRLGIPKQLIEVKNTIKDDLTF